MTTTFDPDAKDCTPVLIGSISLGLIQLIVIGLDVAARVDWFSPTSELGATSPTAQLQNESRWPIYLPFLQFAFVSLLMQYILSRVSHPDPDPEVSCLQLATRFELELNSRAGAGAKQSATFAESHLINLSSTNRHQVAKNKTQVPPAVAHESLVGASARQLANTRRRRRLLPISGGGASQTANATKSPLHLLAPDSLASVNQERRMQWRRRLHQVNQMEENNGKSGLQNIALAHLLVTHILLWLMKLNSISLFQAIEQQASHSYHAHHHHSQSSRPPLLIVPPAQIAQRDIGSPQQGREFLGGGRGESTSAEDKPELANRSNSGQQQQQLSTSVSSQPTTLASPRDELRHQFDRSEREFNRTELERILRTKPSSPTSAQPPLLMTTAINSTQQVRSVVADQQTRAAPAGKEVGKSTHQGAPPDGKAGHPSADEQRVLKQAPLVEPKAIERGLRSASDLERPARQSLEQTAMATTVASNDSVLMMSRAELANLLELATKNVQRLQPAPAAVTLPTTAPGSSSVSTTTQRPQFKSSLPKRMTAFRQIQKPLVLQKVPPPTTTATTTTAATTAATRATTPSSTTTRPPDLSKIISLAPQKKQRARIHISRQIENAPEVSPDSASESAGDEQSPEAGDSNELRGPEQFTSTSERPFPSVESDPELPGSQPYADSELEVTTVDGDGSKLLANQSSAVDDAESDEDSETDLDSLLPPIPDYNNNKNETDANETEESRKVVAFAAMPAADQTKNINNNNNNTSRIPLALVRNQRLDSEEELGQSSKRPAASSSSSQPEPTFGDYLLPIVYQYHILIIAILFSMWLDSLRASSARVQTASRECPTQVGEHLRAASRRQTWSSAANGGCESGASRLVRSRSVESELGRRRSRGCTSGQRHCRHRRQSRRLDEDSSSGSAGDQLSRSNSLRASSEQLLWAGGGGQRRRNARFYSDDQQESDDSSSSSDFSPRNHRRQPVPLITTEKAPASSACSVFLGLLVVSAALIVILVGTEILTLLTQCTTQLLSILVCLVGLCLAWRSQSALKKRSAKHRKCLHQTGRRLLLSRKGAAYLTNPHDIVLSTNTKTNHESFADGAPAGLVESGTPRMGSEAWPQPAAPPAEAGSNHRQCFHYLFLLAAYFCGVSIALNLGKQHTVRQLFPPHIMQFLQRQWLATSGGGGGGGGSRPANSHAHSHGHQQQHDSSGMLFENWGFFWSQSPSQVGGGGQEAPLSPLILFHMALAAKGLLLIVQVTLQTILIRSSCSQRTTRQLRQVYTFLMFTNLSLWAMDICEQQQHLQLVRQDGGHTLQLNGLAEEDNLSSLTADSAAAISGGDSRLKLITLEGFTQFACSIVTLSHLYHGLVFMQR